ncbi:MAG: pantoate--beta-alanine ligase [Candidatus Aminicenantes bacterium]|nr:MAG: pantoate--beta-alanine ligase [Candidatus Aminicenantes bacterium]
MKIITKITELKAEIKALKSNGKIIGLVPTMGCLHEGHLSLVRSSVKKADCTVVSIFVNPKQFSPNEDFREYHRDLKHDSEILKREGVDYLFIPEASAMYPEGFKTYIEVHDLHDKLCGRSRPGHFRGVCTVVLKLFNIVDPDVSFFGQKDTQQAIVLKRMVKDLDLDVNIEILPIIREKDGLALSSRNTYLDPEQRKAALCLSKSLREADEMFKNGERKSARIIRSMEEIIKSEALAKIDYVRIVDLNNLDPLARIEKEALIAVAVFIGKNRLIDNTVINIKE